MLVLGVFWDTIGRLSVNAANIIFTIFLARMLTPNDYGLVAIALSVIVVFESLIEGGFAAAFIQKGRTTKADYSTLFLLQLSVASVALILLQAMAGPLAEFLGYGEIESILRILSLSVFIMALFNTIKVRLMRAVRFQTVAAVEAVSSLLAGVVAIVMAQCGFEYWSLVVQYMLVKAISLMLFWYCAPLKLTGCSFESFKSISHYGLFSSLSSLVRAITNQLDSLVLVKLFGPDFLGVYSRAKALRDLAVNYSGGALGRVFFSVSSRAGVERNNSFYFKTVEIVALLSALISGLFFVSTSELIEILLGSQWLAAVLVLKFLLVADGISKPVGAVMVSTLAGLGKANLEFYGVLVKRAAWLVCLYLLWLYGLNVFLWTLIAHSVFVYIVDALLLFYAAGYRVSRQIISPFKALLVFGLSCGVVELCHVESVGIALNLVVNSLVFLLSFSVLSLVLFSNLSNTILRSLAGLSDGR